MWMPVNLRSLIAYSAIPYSLGLFGKYARILIFCGDMSPVVASTLRGERMGRGGRRRMLPTFPFVHLHAVFIAGVRL
jgi:hypothetical protein